MAKFQKWTIEIAVSNTWVEDGFDINEENKIERLQTMLPHAYGHELKCKILKKPDEKVLKKLWGE